MSKRPSLIVGPGRRRVRRDRGLGGVRRAHCVGQRRQHPVDRLVIAPKKLPKATLMPTTLKVTTKTATTTAANGVPSPADQGHFDFDKSAKLFAKGYPDLRPRPSCRAPRPKRPIATAGSANIGNGHREWPCFRSANRSSPEPTIVTAFNGEPQGGKPVVLLHAYGSAPVQTTLVLVGTVATTTRKATGRAST